MLRKKKHVEGRDDREKFGKKKVCLYDAHQVYHMFDLQRLSLSYAANRLASEMLSSPNPFIRYVSIFA